MKTHTFYRLGRFGIETKRMRCAEARRRRGWFSSRDAAVLGALKAGVAEMHISTVRLKKGESWDGSEYKEGSWEPRVPTGFSRKMLRSARSLFGGRYGVRPGVGPSEE